MDETALREGLVQILKGKGAHMDLETALSDFPPPLCDSRVAGIPHTPWRLLEHMRIAQWDILEFCRNPHHESPEFPDGYWPSRNAVGGEAEWKKTVALFLDDLRAIEDMVSDRQTDLFARIPHGQGQTVLREALLVADHNSYHLGQLMMIRRAGERA
jgi:hypothetical protein